MNHGAILYETWSVCPVCLKRIYAERIQIENKVFLQKCCPEHGSYRTIIWRGYYGINDWIGNTESPAHKDPRCPSGCGLCPDHLGDTCCVILNVTHQCNLECRYCFDRQGNHGNEPTLDEIRASLRQLTKKGKSLVQLSGGEPTTRPDLHEIIKAAKDAGAKYVQLNTNGIRLGEYKEYVSRLAGAGLSFVFMQFDGTDDQIYNKLRGRPLLRIKQKAIENCAACNIGVTLVPTLVRDCNIHNIGSILRFAVSQSPNVRGVHFQPVTYLGRIEKIPEDSDRITLDELIAEIHKQTDGMIHPNNLLPSACDHPLCGFHGDFVVIQDRLVPLLAKGMNAPACCGDPQQAAAKNREFIAKRWLRTSEEREGQEWETGDIHDMEYFLRRVKTHGFTVTSMAFQDAGNLDFSRLRNCSLHVFDQGKFIPFCSYYLQKWDM
ncbi:MAG: radical SAM protein [Bacteroidales bacterium]|nr:radical SAM protein [Lentimicrobiaceae bacterium]MDD5695446.1 radical SAM protein [Bacteroidales bacterium]